MLPFLTQHVLLCMTWCWNRFRKPHWFWNGFCLELDWLWDLWPLSFKGCWENPPGSFGVCVLNTVHFLQLSSFVLPLGLLSPTEPVWSSYSGSIRWFNATMFFPEIIFYDLHVTKNAQAVLGPCALLLLLNYNLSPVILAPWPAPSLHLPHTEQLSLKIKQRYQSCLDEVLLNYQAKWHKLCPWSFTQLWYTSWRDKHSNDGPKEREW